MFAFFMLIQTFKESIWIKDEYQNGIKFQVNPPIRFYGLRRYKFLLLTQSIIFKTKEIIIFDKKLSYDDIDSVEKVADKIVKINLNKIIINKINQNKWSKLFGINSIIRNEFIAFNSKNIENILNEFKKNKIKILKY